MIKKFFLVAVVMTMLVIGSNPADYDPFHDNPSDTYQLLAADMPFPMPQEVPTNQDGTIRIDNPNRAGHPWVQPPKGPNADACKAFWDKTSPCPVDGQYYGQWGELQPENCDNNHFMPDGKTLKPDAEKCHCNIAMTDADHCPMNDNGHLSIDGSTCMVYCREKKYESNGNVISHCHCILQCDSASEEDLKALQPAPKRGKK